MTENLNARLQAAVTERDRLASNAQRILGQKEAAEKNLEAVRQEIQIKDLDPDKLDETIEQLEAALTEAVKDLEHGVNVAKEALKPYMENT